MRQGGGVARAGAARLAAGLLLAAGLAGCSTTPPSGGLPGDAPPARFGTVVVSEGDTGRRIVVKPGDCREGCLGGGTGFLRGVGARLCGLGKRKRGGEQDRTQRVDLPQGGYGQAAA